MIKVKKIFLLLIGSLVCTISLAVPSDNFDILVIPSLMNEKMDNWYQVPKNSNPYIPVCKKVYPGQEFAVLVFFNYSDAKPSSDIHLTYNLKVLDPSGKPTKDKVENILAFKGKYNEISGLILSSDIIMMLFTEKYQLGDYKIIVTASDRGNNYSITKEVSIKLTSIDLNYIFKSDQEVSEWIMSYYKHNEISKAIAAYLYFTNVFVDIWDKESAYSLDTFVKIFSNNKFVFDNIYRNMGYYSDEDKLKILLLVKFCIPEKFDQFKTFTSQKLDKVINYRLPEIKNNITSAHELDMLWGEFLVTGTIEPIRKIISALDLIRYRNSVKRGASEDDVMRAVVHGSAVWSLKSNCKNIDLVNKYCQFILYNDQLPLHIKTQLDSILKEVN